MACAAMAWQARQALDTASILVSWDLQGHLLRARHAFDSWFPWWHGGFPLNDVYPPLVSWILAAFEAVGAGGAAARLIMVAAWAGIVPCSYFFLRSFGMDRVSAAAGACLGIAIDASWTFGAYAIFTLGLLPNAVGFLLAITALACARRLVSPGSTKADIARAALAGGLTVLAHPIAAAWLAAAWIILFASARAGETVPTARPTAIAAAWAAAIGGYYWLPFLANQASMLTTEPFMPRTVPTVWHALAHLDGMGGPIAAALAAAGLITLNRREDRTALLLITGLLAAGFVLTAGLLAPILPASGAAGRSQWGRFEGFYGWSALMAASFFLPAARFRVSPGAGRIVATIVAVAGIAVVALTGLRRQGRHITTITPAAAESIDRLIVQLRAVHRAGDFVLSENAYDMAPVFGSPHALNQRVPAGNLRDQGGGFPEGTAGSERFFRLSREFPGGPLNARDALGAGGVRFLVTGLRSSRDAFEKVPWLRKVWADPVIDGLALFEVQDFNRRFGLPPELSKRLSDVILSDDGNQELRFPGEENLPYPFTVAAAYHPRLRVIADGQPVSLRSGAYGRLEFIGGPGSAGDIRIWPVVPAWLVGVRILSLLALGAALLAALRRKVTESPRP